MLYLIFFLCSLVNFSISDPKPKEEHLNVLGDSIAQYLQTHEITKNNTDGKIFCSYKILLQKKYQEHTDYYLTSVCQEFYEVNRTLSCSSEALKIECLDKGGNGTVQEFFQEKEFDVYHPYLSQCDSSCRDEPLIPSILKIGAGSAGGIIVLTQSNTTQDITKYWSPDFPHEMDTPPPEYTLYLPEAMKHLEQYDNRELDLFTRKRAEMFFHRLYKE